MSTRILWAIGAAFLATAAVAQIAPQGGDDRGGMMMRADTNHDGKISAAEMQAAALKRFDKMDANHDGFLDASERKGAMMKGRDSDSDGKISRAETATRSAKRFARMDTNRDGYIDAGEMQAMRDRREAMGGK